MLMEKLMHARSRFSDKKTTICTVRYGNVMFSRGSVLPLFFQQIKEGKDIYCNRQKNDKIFNVIDKCY